MNRRIKVLQTSALPLGYGAQNEALTVDRQVSWVKLYYRVSGGDYVTVEMSADGSTYSLEISSESVTVTGVEYYLESSDGTNMATSPENAPGNFYTITVEHQPSFDENIL